MTDTHIFYKLLLCYTILAPAIVKSLSFETTIVKNFARLLAKILLVCTVMGILLSLQL